LLAALTVEGSFIKYVFFIWIVYGRMGMFLSLICCMQYDHMNMNMINMKCRCRLWNLIIFIAGLRVIIVSKAKMRKRKKTNSAQKGFLLLN